MKAENPTNNRLATHQNKQGIFHKNEKDRNGKKRKKNYQITFKPAAILCSTTRSMDRLYPLVSLVPRHYVCCLLAFVNHVFRTSSTTAVTSGTTCSIAAVVSAPPEMRQRTQYPKKTIVIRSCAATTTTIRVSWLALNTAIYQVPHRLALIPESESSLLEIVIFRKISESTAESRERLLYRCVGGAI